MRSGYRARSRARATRARARAATPARARGRAAATPATPGTPPSAESSLTVPRLGTLLWTAAALGCLCGAAKPPRQPVVHKVVIENMVFSPDALEVRPGDTIVWMNKDFFPHTATAEDGS